jgi:hypothetical protein
MPQREASLAAQLEVPYGPVRLLCRSCNSRRGAPRGASSFLGVPNPVGVLLMVPSVRALAHDSVRQFAKITPNHHLPESIESALIIGECSHEPFELALFKVGCERIDQHVVSKDRRIPVSTRLPRSRPIH